jgi:hypothetical protein
MNNNSKARFKLTNRKDRSAAVSDANPRNKWNTKGKVARGGKGGTKEKE